MKKINARIPLYLAALSLVFPLAACGGDAAETEGELQIVTQAPLVTTPGAAMEGYDLDLFSEHKTDDAIVTAETEADPEKPTANEGYKNPKADFDDPVDLSGGRFIPVGDSGILYVELPEPPETAAEETEKEKSGKDKSGKKAETTAETTAEPAEPDITGLPVYAVIKKGETFDRYRCSTLEFDAFRVEKGHRQYSARAGALYDYSGETLIMFPRSSIADVFEIPAFTLAIDESAFEGARLVEIYPDAELKYVSNRAFAGCAALTKITLGDSVEFVGDEAFSGCTALTSLVIGASCRVIGAGVADGCASLAYVRVNADIFTIKTREGEIPFSDTPWYTETDREFLTLGALLIKYTGRGGEVIIDFSVKYIPEYVFSSDKVTKLVMSRDVALLNYHLWDENITIQYT
ncbi:MAG TPA: leucine-rich repeat domain-containing protein [Clostridiales bacterium]|jgi:hypothetical protein|nr:leucine-rich repeat domain-containing protein [Clostridiales bacterium]